MFKSLLFISFYLVLVSAKSKLHHKNDSPLTSSLSTCDVQSIKELGRQVASLTSDTATSVVANAVAAVIDIAYCLWPLDLYFCLEGDAEFAILENLGEIGESLVEYVEKLQPLLKEITDDVAACASV